jgi:hypothetical protein
MKAGGRRLRVFNLEEEEEGGEEEADDDVGEMVEGWTTRYHPTKPSKM